MTDRTDEAGGCIAEVNLIRGQTHSTPLRFAQGDKGGGRDVRLRHEPCVSWRAGIVLHACMASHTQGISLDSALLRSR